MLCFLGAPWIPVISVGLYLLDWKFGAGGTETLLSLDPEKVKTALGFGYFASILIFGKNCMWIGTGRKYTFWNWMDKYKPAPRINSKRKHDAQYPPMDERYLSDVPDGLVVGKDKSGKYIRYPICKGHARSAIILGTPGAGKSTLLLTSIIHNMFFEKDLDKRQTYFLFDPKPEVRRKATPKDDSIIRELSIQDRQQWGWDIYFRIRTLTKDDDILSELDVIARALIDAGKNEKNEFFYESARTIFKYTALADIKAGKSFMDTIDYITGCDTEKLVKEVLENAEDSFDLKKVKHGLGAYADKGESEAFQGIEMAFHQSLPVLMNDDSRFFFDLNPRKVSSQTLEEKVSIAFTIKTTRIKEYKSVLRLVVMQLIHHLEDRDEDNSHMITMVIEEAFRLGLINWISFLSVCRSKQICCILAFQGLSQMKSVWNADDADSLLEMVSVIEVLSCASSTTASVTLYRSIFRLRFARIRIVCFEKQKERLSREWFTRKIPLQM